MSSLLFFNLILGQFNISIMTFEDFRNYCLNKPGVTEDYPFEGETAWMKVMGKLFAISNIVEMKRGKELVPPFHFINMKCDPDRAIDLRERFVEIEPGWHQNKKHWNSVYMNQGLPESLVYELIDHSYELVVASLTKKIQEDLKNML